MITLKEKRQYDTLITKSFVAGFITGVIAGSMFTLTIIIVFYL